MVLSRSRVRNFGLQLAQTPVEFVALMSQQKSPPDVMEKIVSLCKRRGFIFQSSEIYGGLNGFWDYGPLGAELKRNVKELWWKSMTRFRDDVVGLDATIIMHPNIWKASGHLETFADPMVDCLLTKKRYRADQIEPQSGIVHRFWNAVSFEALWSAALKFQVRHDQWDKEKVVNYIGTAKSNDELHNRVRESLVQAKVSFASDEINVLYSSVDDVLTTLANVEFAVLLPPGKPPESARKLALQFYSERGVKDPVLLGESTEKAENTTRYNPENGALLTEPKMFNLMFKTFVGATESEDSVAYLRPETAQAIFAQFKNVVDSSRVKVPFGIAQVGKAFRNEINPRNFTFRSREFEQMELEFFIKPDEVVEKQAGSVAKLEGEGHPGEPQQNWGWEVWHKYWVEERIRFYESIGLPRTTLEEYWQKKEELAHYAKACVDILFKFPFGTQELEGIAARGDFDLSQHQKHSGKSMEYFDQEANTRYVPHVIEPSAGADRLVLALLCNAYHEETATDEKGKTETRVVLRFHPRIAPIKVGVFPLMKNKPELVAKALEVRDLLRQHMNIFYDETGSIGRRYARQDEAGTPFGVTVDFDTVGENGPELKDTVTLRHRDDARQERVKISDLLARILPEVF
jgi:glycyl-tRNA synthetase